jgi:hypothetical protein
MYLNVKPAQDFANKSVRRQAETGGEERLEHNQLALRLGDFLRPQDTRNSSTIKLLSVSSETPLYGNILGIT